jgi:redox-sensitive bicupin YhaK (pirin superfamily)
MLAIRRAAERGHDNHGWLDSHYTFSFGNHHDPERMGLSNLRLIGSREGSVTIQQDVDLYATRLSEGEHVNHGLAAGRNGWIHVAPGSAPLNGKRLQAGDGVAVEGPDTLALTGVSEGDVLPFDMG